MQNMVKFDSRIKKQKIINNCSTEFSGALMLHKSLNDLVQVEVKYLFVQKPSADHDLPIEDETFTTGRIRTCSPVKESILKVINDVERQDSTSSTTVVDLPHTSNSNQEKEDIVQHGKVGILVPNCSQKRPSYPSCSSGHSSENRISPFSQILSQVVFLVTRFIGVDLRNQACPSVRSREPSIRFSDFLHEVLYQ